MRWELVLGATLLGAGPTPYPEWPSGPPFDRGALAAALKAVDVSACKQAGGPTGSGHIKIILANDGSVQSVVVDQPPFAGTAVGKCVAGKFRSVHIPSFGGEPVTAGYSFVIN